MEAITTIKNELINQKNEIEKKYGVVSVAYDYPSPTEITEGIKTIPYVDLSHSTATEADVARGKTFFSGDATLRTGTANVDVDAIDMIFFALNETVMTEKEFYVTLPSHLTKINKYKFFSNYNYVTVAFNDACSVIDEYAFYKATNFKFENFNTLENLKTISNYAFSYCKCDGLNYGQLPNSITTIGQYCFYNSDAENMDFRLPNSLSSFNVAAFMGSKRLHQRGLDLSNFTLSKLPSNTFYYNCFNSDLIMPDNIQTIGTNCFYDGCVNNIVFGPSITKLDSYCFGGTGTHAASNFYLNSVVFESETPPTIGTKIFAMQNLQHDYFKIYVPDNAIEEYRAVTNLQNYLSAILPMSQKP